VGIWLADAQSFAWGKFMEESEDGDKKAVQAANREKILKTHPHLRDFLPLLDAMNDESRRGSVILSCSFIDDQLRNILLSFLVEGKVGNDLIDGYNPPLGTFSARADAAFAMGLIGKTEYDEISILRKIRNVFAHDFRINFEDPEVASLCARLKFAAKDYADIIVDSFGQYHTSAVALILSLTNRDHRVSKLRLKAGTWEY
jgi:hypothetical protein